MLAFRSIFCFAAAIMFSMLFTGSHVYAQQAGRSAVVKVPTPAQQTAINALNATLQDHYKLVAERKAALNEVTFALPLKEKAIKEANAALGDAEQELAYALAAGFANLQASPERLSPQLIPAIASSRPTGGRGMGGGFFGRRVRPSDDQQAALDAFSASLQDRQQNLAEQRETLEALTYALPSNDPALKAGLAEVSAAEEDLALARALGFASLQASDNKLGPELVELMVSRGGEMGRRGRRPAVPNPADDLAGFVSLFDGETLNGWDGDPMFWRAEDGMIVAESTPEKVVQENTFLFWRNGIVKDFELKLEYRFVTNSGNSGIQVRSREMTTGRDGQPRKWGIAGYQIDMVAEGGIGSGLIYGEGGGGFMARQGTVTRRLPDGLKQISTLGDDITPYFNPAGEWNSYHIIVRDNTISVFINGRIVSMLIDENMDPEQGYALEGLLALQMHVGDPFRLEFKNIYMKAL